jgi:Delta14-sterol reductase
MPPKRPNGNSTLTCPHRIGAFGIVFVLPVLVYAFAFFCNDVSGCPAPSLLHPSTLTLGRLKDEIGWPEDGFTALYDTQVTLWVLAYYLLSLLLQIFLPGIIVEGTQLACGGRHRYKFNCEIKYHTPFHPHLQ